MHGVTLALAVLLGAGFAAAKLGQRLRLPSVTGYIFAGVLLGPSVLNLITEEVTGDRLNHFTHIALMLIAFGIGEHLELKPLRRTAKHVGFIGIGETMGAFWLVAGGSFAMALLTGVGIGSWGVVDFAVLAVLLGAVSVATAPAATLHVMRELKAAGPLTGTLMAVVAVDDGLAIMIFGIAVSLARHLVGSGSSTIFVSVLSSLTEILSSLLMGLVTGLIIDFVVHRLRRRGEMLTAGLALLLLCGEGARALHLSPLLAGMATGFTIVNRDRRDVRLFRSINAFEPPIYVLFFTLAGTHLDLSALSVAGWVGLGYFLLRALGKLAGAKVGARMAGAPAAVQNYLGLALVPQAGVAIGLIFLIKGHPSLETYSRVIIPVVLSSVVLSELIGPLCARFAVTRSGESGVEETASPPSEHGAPLTTSAPEDQEQAQLLPWTRERLTPPHRFTGSVILGVAQVTTAGSLTRMGTLLAHQHQSMPVAVHVALSDATSREDDTTDPDVLFEMAKAEAGNLGYPMETEKVRAETVVQGLLRTARTRNARAVVLGHPATGTQQAFQRTVEPLARQAPCQVMVVRSAGIVHTEKILVPVAAPTELDVLGGVIHALSDVGRHRITLLTMVQSDALEEDTEEAEEELLRWAEEEGLASSVRCRALATEARLDAIVQEARTHDVLIMAATQLRGLKRLFFGSLAEDVAQHCRKPMIMVHTPGSEGTGTVP